MVVVSASVVAGCEGVVDVVDVRMVVEVRNVDPLVWVGLVVMVRVVLLQAMVVVVVTLAAVVGTTVTVVVVIVVSDLVIFVGVLWQILLYPGL